MNAVYGLFFVLFIVNSLVSLTFGLSLKKRISADTGNDAEADLRAAASWLVIVGTIGVATVLLFLFTSGFFVLAATIAVMPIISIVGIGMSLLFSATVSSSDRRNKKAGHLLAGMWATGAILAFVFS